MASHIRNVNPIAARKAPAMIRRSSRRAKIMPMPKITKNAAANVRKTNQIFMSGTIRGNTTDSKWDVRNE